MIRLSVSVFYKIVCYILIFLMLFSPFAFTPIKMTCITILLLSVIINFSFFSEKNKVSRSVIIWFTLFILHGVFFLFVGLINGAKVDYVLKFATVAVIWPLVFAVLFFYRIDDKFLISFYKVIEISTICISLYAIYKVIALTGMVPNIDIYPREVPVELDFSDGNVEMSLPAATTLMFTVPSIVSLYLLTKQKRLLPTIFLSLIAIVLISRRALLLNVFITPILCLAISGFFLKKSNLKKLVKNILFVYSISVIISILVFTLLAHLGIFDVKIFFTMLLEGFDFSGKNSVDPGAEIRAEQFRFLFQSWMEKPFLGWGYGSVSRYIIRSDETPFIYELSYMALLFQTGLFGTTVYLSLICWIYFKMCKLKNYVSVFFNNYNIAILVGLTTFLLANATNPYLYAFDHMWTIFLPLLFINTLALKKNES